MNLVFAFPADPLHSGIDEAFKEQAEALKFAGFEVGIIREDRLVFKKDIQGSVVMYRGWMLNPNEYVEFRRLVEQAKAYLFHSLDNYLATHYVPRWYPFITDLTPETIFLPNQKDSCLDLKDLANKNWEAFVFKDYVKSLKTSIGSTIKDLKLAPQVVADMIKYRGEIEGGLCIRKWEPIDPASEQRYFVYKGKPFSSDGSAIPTIVHTVADRVKTSRFFSVDIAIRDDGTPRVIELGDGQVSDLVDWDLAAFLNILI